MNELPRNTPLDLAQCEAAAEWLDGLDYVTAAALTRLAAREGARVRWDSTPEYALLLLDGAVSTPLLVALRLAEARDRLAILRGDPGASSFLPTRRDAFMATQYGVEGDSEWFWVFYW